MVLDLRTFDSDICNETILIRGRLLSRGARPFVSESSPGSVRMAPIELSPHSITSANSDG
jgi:hypothetical protein